jgi:hypothetical protein
MFTVLFICSGCRDALWFSTKFEKKMAAMEDETPASPLTRFQRDVPIRQSKLNSGISLFHEYIM